MGIFLHYIDMLPAHPLGGQAVEIALVFGIIGHWRPRHARRAKNRLSVYRRRSYGLFDRRLQGPYPGSCPRKPRITNALRRRAKAAGSPGTWPSRIWAWSNSNAERSATSSSRLALSAVARASTRPWFMFSSRMGFTAAP